MAFSNDTLQALYDRSPGFFQRQLILEAKAQDPNRKNDPYLVEKLCTEKEDILLWALEGLYRLILNDFAIFESERAKENRMAAMADGNNLLFLWHRKATSASRQIQKSVPGISTLCT